MRRELDEQIVGRVAHRVDRLREPHWLAHVAAEIPSVEDYIVREAAGDRRIDWDLRRRAAYCAKLFDQHSLEWRHLRAVEGVMHRKQPVVDAACVQGRQDRIQRL